MFYTGLITTDDLARDAVSSLDVMNMVEAAEQAIIDVTQQIETYLGRKLIVHKTRQAVPEATWRDDEVLTGKVWWWADEWPVVETITPNLETHPDSSRVQLAEANREAGTYEYFAGYRRQDQKLSDLQEEPELSSLSVLPEVLPADISRVAVELVLYTLHQARGGTYGRGSVAQEVGSSTMTVERADTRFVGRTLSRINRYRRVAC